MKQREPRYQKQLLEVKAEPDKVAAFIEAVSVPTNRSVAKAAKSSGLPEPAARALEKRLSTEYLPLKLAVEEVKTSELLGLVSDRARRVLDAVSQEDIERATLRDKAIAFGIFVEKRQLLSGEPTHLISIQERGHLDVVARKLLREAARRGIDMQLDPVSSEYRAAEEMVEADRHILLRNERRELP